MSSYLWHQGSFIPSQPHPGPFDVAEVTTRVVDAAGPLDFVSVTIDNLAPLGEVLSTNGARSGDVKRYRNSAFRQVPVNLLSLLSLAALFL